MHTVLERAQKQSGPDEQLSNHHLFQGTEFASPVLEKPPPNTEQAEPHTIANGVAQQAIQGAANAVEESREAVTGKSDAATRISAAKGASTDADPAGTATAATEAVMTSDLLAAVAAEASEAVPAKSNTNTGMSARHAIR